MKNEDEGLEAVREVRERISAELGDDPDRLVQHYLVEQEKYRDRLLRPPAPSPPEAMDDDAEHSG